IAVTLNITIPGLDKAEAQTLVEKAHVVCPYSHAKRGNIPVTLNVKQYRKPREGTYGGLHARRRCGVISALAAVAVLRVGAAAGLAKRHVLALQLLQHGADTGKRPGGRAEAIGARFEQAGGDIG